MNKINTYKTASDAYIEVTHRLVKLAKTGGNVALSGGETPKLLFNIMAEQFRDTDWSKLNFFWGDERMVPPESAESNYGFFFRTLVSTELIDRQQVFQISYFGNEEKSLKDYQAKLQEKVPFKNGFPQFDLIILGLGEDGHTASIFPDNLESFTSLEMAEITMHPNGQQRRITLTGSTLNSAKAVYFLTTGEGKRDIINEVIIQKNMALPATLVNKPQITWFIDEAAATKL